jgi:hypothetical protein
MLNRPLTFFSRAPTVIFTQGLHFLCAMERGGTTCILSAGQAGRLEISTKMSQTPLLPSRTAWLRCNIGNLLLALAMQGLHHCYMRCAACCVSTLRSIDFFYVIFFP